MKQGVLQKSKILGMKVEVNAVKQQLAKTPCQTVSARAYSFTEGGEPSAEQTKPLRNHGPTFTECPYEKLAAPQRVHIDLYGYVRI